MTGLSFRGKMVKRHNATLMRRAGCLILLICALCSVAGALAPSRFHRRNMKMDNLASPQVERTGVPFLQPQAIQYQRMILENNIFIRRNTTNSNIALYVRQREVVDDFDGDADLAWSVLSNTFFVGGGVSYLVLSLWDIFGADKMASCEPCALLYFLVSLVAPAVYLFNAVIDVAWANSIMDMKPFNQGDNIIDQILLLTGSRRELLSAVSFGIAALFALMSASTPLLQGSAVLDLDLNDNILVKVSSNWDAALLEMMSVHTYLLSAFFALLGSPGDSEEIPSLLAPSAEKARRLEGWGDALFGIGSCIDVILFDFTWDDSIVWWPVLSAVLWLLDALCYLRADVIELESLNNDS